MLEKILYTKAVQLGANVTAIDINETVLDSLNDMYEDKITTHIVEVMKLLHQFVLQI